jgi:hypothetical protein
LPASATVSPGRTGQTTAGKRAPMLGKWPIPDKLSWMVALDGGLWIRRVPVRDQEGQLGSRTLYCSTIFPGVQSPKGEACQKSPCERWSRTSVRNLSGHTISMSRRGRHSMNSRKSWKQRWTGQPAQGQRQSLHCADVWRTGCVSWKSHTRESRRRWGTLSTRWRSTGYSHVRVS